MTIDNPLLQGTTLGDRAKSPHELMQYYDQRGRPYWLHNLVLTSDVKGYIDPRLTDFRNNVNVHAHSENWMLVNGDGSMKVYVNMQHVVRFELHTE